jgi:hypothetical protein
MTCDILVNTDPSLTTGTCAGRATGRHASTSRAKPHHKEGRRPFQSTAYTFNGLRFDEYGAYRFQLSLDRSSPHSVPLSVIPPAVSSVIPGSFDLPQGDQR